MAIVEIAYQRDPGTGQILFDANGYPIYDNPANAGANTYADLQARIADEVLGSPTATQIKNAIQDAIQSFERQAFWFNDMRFFGVTGSASTLQTIQAQEFYSWQDLPSLINFAGITNVVNVAFNNRYPLVSRTKEWIDLASVSLTWQGLPTDYCWQAGSLRLYPVPNGGYPLIVSGTTRFPALANDTDYSAWTNRAEPLIRFEAKRLLFLNITRNPLQVVAMEREIYGDPGSGKQGILAQLRRESTSRGGVKGGIRASRGYL